MERERKQRYIKTHKSSREREREIAREIAKKRGRERQSKNCQAREPKPHRPSTSRDSACQVPASLYLGDSYDCSQEIACSLSPPSCSLESRVAVLQARQQARQGFFSLSLVFRFLPSSLSLPLSQVALTGLHKHAALPAGEEV